MLGKNGAGKSTLLRILGGVDYPDSGMIKRSCSISWPVGLIGGFQGSMSARENVTFVSRIYCNRFHYYEFRCKFRIIKINGEFLWQK